MPNHICFFYCQLVKNIRVHIYSYGYSTVVISAQVLIKLIEEELMGFSES